MNPQSAAPSGRVLADWWRQLASQSPRQLWLVDWLIHRLEVLARGTRSESLDQLQRLLLEGLALPRPTGTDSCLSRKSAKPSDAIDHAASGSGSSTDAGSYSSAAELAKRLGIDAGLIAGFLTDAVGRGLAESGPDRTWRLTDLGRTAIKAEVFARTTFERRTFYLRNNPPGFLPLKEPGHPVTILETPPAPLTELQACVERPAVWKERVGFPTSVEAIADMTASLPLSTEPWMRIPVDRPERLIAAMIRRADGRVVIYAAKQEDWSLHSEPVLDLAADAAHELLPLSDKTADAWRQPWNTWCRMIRGVTAAEADAASLEKSGHRLVVRAPQLADRLRLARTELFRGEAWLFAGEPHTREALQIELKV
jgi:hypothetical protein